MGEMGKLWVSENTHRRARGLFKDAILICEQPAVPIEHREQSTFRQHRRSFVCLRVSSHMPRRKTHTQKTRLPAAPTRTLPPPVPRLSVHAPR